MSPLETTCATIDVQTPPPKKVIQRCPDACEKGFSAG